MNFKMSAIVSILNVISLLFAKFAHVQTECQDCQHKISGVENLYFKMTTMVVILDDDTSPFELIWIYPMALCYKKNISLVGNETK